MEEKRGYLQVFSGIAIMFVVIIHANAYYLHNILNLTKYIEAGYMYYFIDTLLQVAVAMFIFIAGYKYEMTRKKRNLKRFYISKVNNIIKPFLIISLLFIVPILIGSIGKRIVLSQSIDIVFYIIIFIQRVWNIIIGYNEVYQLWYTPLYIMILFSYPIIEKILKSSKSRLLVFIIFTIIQTLAAATIEMFSKHPFDFIYYFCVFEFGIIFYRNKSLKETSFKEVLIVYIITLICATSFNNELMSDFFNKTLLNPISCMFYYYLSRRFEYNEILNYIGEYSFYIYLFHEPIYMKSISVVINKVGFYKTWTPVPMVCIGGILLSILTYKFLIKFKIGRYCLNVAPIKSIYSSKSTNAFSKN